MPNKITYLGKAYNDDEILSASFSKKQSLNMSELSVDTAEITLRPYLNLDFFVTRYHNNDLASTIPNDEPDAPFPMFTRDGLRFETSETNPFAEHFQQNTPIKQYKDGSQIAIWYLQSVERQSKNIYQLSAMSALGKLTQITHYGGIYTGETAATVIADIIGNQVSYYISPIFRNVALYGWLPIATARDNLQQVLFALNANLSVNNSGTLRIENLPLNPTAIPQDSIYSSNANVKQSTPVTEVVVLEHKYAVGSGTKTLFDGTAFGQIVTFDEPVSNLLWNGSALTTEHGANYAVLPSTGTGTLTGTPYIHTTREVSRKGSQYGLSDATEQNVARVENATLVGNTASAIVANRLAAYYACRTSINVDVADSISKSGNVVDLFDPYDEITKSACIESAQVTVSAVLKSKISALVGFTPWQQQTMRDIHDIVSVSDTYVFGNNVLAGTEVTCIIIGGGQGGYNGKKGKNGGANPVSGKASSTTLSVSTQEGTGGNGGLGGNGGSGGKVLIVSFVVSPNDSAVVSIGAGGAINGGLGGNTTVTINQTTYSSATGSSVTYYDDIDHITYGINGLTGVKGANGGDGGKATATAGEVGKNGGNVGNYTGGTGGAGDHWSSSIVGDNSYESIGGGGGGGAGTNGNGTAGLTIPSSFQYGTPLYGGDGGIGSNASTPIHYGDGGNGGDGGGGGGGAPGAQIYNTHVTPGDQYWYNMVGGTGGNGGSASAGNSGCAIFIYRVPTA